MTERVCVALIYLLPHIFIGKRRIILLALIEPPIDLCHQGVDARQTPGKIQFSSSANSFDSIADRFVVMDTQLFQPCMGCLMYDCRCDAFDRCGFRTNKTLVKQTGIYGMPIAASPVRKQLHPNSR